MARGGWYKLTTVSVPGPSMSDGIRHIPLDLGPSRTDAINLTSPVSHDTFLLSNKSPVTRLLRFSFAPLSIVIITLGLMGEKLTRPFIHLT